MLMAVAPACPERMAANGLAKTRSHPGVDAARAITVQDFDRTKIMVAVMVGEYSRASSAVDGADGDVSYLTWISQDVSNLAMLATNSSIKFQ